MKKNILVVAAHPDDEVLGCGGTIRRHTEEGDKVHVLIAAEGLTSRGDKREEFSNELLKLKRTAETANLLLGVHSLEFLEFPDNQMDSVPLLEVIKKIEFFASKIRPEVVYTHHLGDVNVDHQVVHQAVYTAFRPLPGSSLKTMLFFEVLSSTEWMPAHSGKMFTPNWYVDISKTLNCKLEALKTYEQEMRPWPHPRSYEAVGHLAHLRGSTVGTTAAEAFMLGRHRN